MSAIRNERKHTQVASKAAPYPVSNTQPTCPKYTVKQAPPLKGALSSDDPTEAEVIQQGWYLLQAIKEYYDQPDTFNEEAVKSIWLGNDCSCCMLKEHFEAFGDEALPTFWLYTKTANKDNAAGKEWNWYSADCTEDAFEDSLIDAEEHDGKQGPPSEKPWVEGVDFLVYSSPLEAADFRKWLQDNFQGKPFDDCTCDYYSGDDEEEPGDTSEDEAEDSNVSDCE